MSNYASALLLGMADSMAEPEPFPVEPLTLGELVWPPVPASADAIGLVVGITVAVAVGRVCDGEEDTIPLSVLLAPQPQSIAAIVKLTPGAHVGILTHSLRFGALLQEHCRSYALGAVLDEPALLQPGAAFEAYLRGKSVILVPEGYENDCAPEVLGALRRFARRGSVVPCAYRIDEGSRIYLTERLERLRSGLTAERAAWA